LWSGDSDLGGNDRSFWQVAEQKGEGYGQNDNRMKEESSWELGKPRAGGAKPRSNSTVQICKWLKALSVKIMAMGSSALKRL